VIDYDLIPTGEGVPKMVTTKQLAEWLYVTPTTIRTWTKDGILPKPVNLKRRKSLYNVEEVRTRLREVIEGRWTVAEGGTNGKV
jgi:DNA-binding transcriptional MerR regulator